ncbi:MFS transporter [Nocardioides sp. LHD-245]|uniref:MFS transporter n=1 Tax=Nocardioides sp. LHD-245 TaxID=3051387 RepID=UPI0027E09597|nr:MFS transporter [Nocardioides sp. LHD-245]
MTVSEGPGTSGGAQQAGRPGRRGPDGRDIGRWWALAALTGANMLVFASVTILNVALPDLRTDLSLTAGTTRWVVTLYSLVFGMLILLGGRLGDVLGLRSCLVGGLVGFSAASVLGGLAANAELLLLARALQGGAGALVAATAVSLMSVTFPAGRDRALAFAVLGVVMGVGTPGSLLLGGLLVDLLSWRWCLLVNVPLALLAAVGVQLFAPPGERRAGARVDVAGAALAGLGLAAVVGGLDRATAWGWSDARTLGLLLGGAVALAGFALALRRATDPLIPPHLLRRRTRSLGYLAAFFVGVAMFAGMFVLTVFLQVAHDRSPTEIGIAFVPFMLGAVAITWVLPALRASVSSSSVLALGLAAAGGAVLTLALLSARSTYATGVLPAMVLLGVGGTIVMITAADLATADAGGDSGVAGSMVNSAQQLGAGLGTALLTSVMTTTTHAELTGGAEPVAAAVAGYARSGLVGGTIVILAACLVWAMRAQPRPGAATRPGA